MNTEKLINSTVRAAYDSWQRGDLKPGYLILQLMPDCIYFKFHINPDGKINRLEIGQADY